VTSNLSDGGNYKTIVMDATGKIVIDFNSEFEEGVSDLQLDISKLPSGLYFLNLRNENISISKSFIKQ
jgi:hypothetical protein